MHEYTIHRRIVKSCHLKKQNKTKQKRDVKHKRANKSDPSTYSINFMSISVKNTQKKKKSKSKS